MNVIAADSRADAEAQLQAIRRIRAVGLFGRGRQFEGMDFEEAADALLAQGAAHHVDQMLTHTALGTPDEVGEFLDGFGKLADADELIVAHQSPTVEGRLRSVTLLAEGMAARST